MDVSPSSSNTRCFAYSLDHPSREPIYIPHNIRIFLGRDPRTRVKDRQCSRRQLSILANYTTRDFEVRHEGQTEAVIDGHRVTHKESYTLRSPATIELRPGQHKFLIKLDQDKSKDKEKKKDQYDYWRDGKTVPDFGDFTFKNKRLRLSTHSVTATESAMSPGWSKHETLLIYRAGELYDKPLVAAFDLDGTIIKTKSGYIFAKNKDDWTLWSSQVKPKLEQLSDKGYKIVILTNQGGMSSGRTNHNDFKTKIENIAVCLDIPLLFLIATNSDRFRKPAPGMWNYMVEKSATPIFYPGSIMVGDAAGRVKGWEMGKKKDFSCSDRLFAKNLGLTFLTPEEFFLDKNPAPFALPLFAPQEYEDANLDDNLLQQKHEVIMMVGAPGSGKSSFCQRNIIPHGYQHISRDELQTWQKCVSLLERTLQQKKSAVIDNINCDPESRKRYLDICKKHNVPVRCFVMNSCKNRCLHNNYVRLLAGNVAKPVPSTYIMKVFNTFVKPSLDEGFEEIVNIPFLPCFPTLKEQDSYHMYYDTFS